MKKLITLIVAAVMAVACCFSLTACGEKEKAYEGIKKVEDASKIKIGMIYLHDENSTYDKNFMDAAEAIKAQYPGITVTNVVNIDESNDCYNEAVKFAEEGYDIVFADSFGHEEYLLKAAKEYPNVQFCHATGTTAHTEVRGNFHNAFASIYEGRYLAGLVAGLKLNEMAAADPTIVKDGKIKVGYVGAFPYAEVKSGYTSWYLGVKAACTNDVVMDVKFTNSWYDFAKEKESAQSLISGGCVLISQHADSMGAPEACYSATNPVPNVTYNLDTRTIKTECANSYLVASKINWAPYLSYVIECVKSGTEIAYDWVGTVANGAVQVLGVNGSLFADNGVIANAKIEEAKAEMANGQLFVFDTDNFTVGGKKLTSYRADVDSDANFTPDTEAIFADYTNGSVYFHESANGLRSAPYFDINIDGITILADANN